MYDDGIRGQRYLRQAAPRVDVYIRYSAFCNRCEERESIDRSPCRPAVASARALAKRPQSIRHGYVVFTVI